MKKLYVYLIVLISYNGLYGQGNGTVHPLSVMVNGTDREYRLYKPLDTEGPGAIPVVFAFHGLGNPIESLIEITQLNLVADSAKFFIVYPQGLEVYAKNIDMTGSGWNIPDVYEATQNDVDFVVRMIEDLHMNPDFNIDLERIYATGWSNGGHFSFYLACEIANRIAAVAAVSTQMSDTLVNHMCVPSRQISSLHMLGTEDPFHPKKGDEYWLPLFGAAEYWSTLNNCNPIPDSLNLEDIDPSDSSTVTLFSYNGCDNNQEVLLYRINEGGHTWSGGYLPEGWENYFGKLNNDIHASVEIWNFFRTIKHPNPVFIKKINKPKEIFLIYPNPAKDKLFIELDENNSGTIKIINTVGQLIYFQVLDRNRSNNYQIDLSTFQNGIYIVSFINQESIVSQKIIKSL